MIDYVPAKVVVREDRREKRVCAPRDDGEHVRAPLGEKVKLGTRLVIQLLVDKYVDGLPLHRQRERFQRLGIDLLVPTLAPIYFARCGGRHSMHLDGAGRPVLDGTVRGKTRLGTLWATSTRPTRSPRTATPRRRRRTRN